MQIAGLPFRYCDRHVGRGGMIEFIGTGKVYPGGVVGLRDVTLKILDGEFVAIIGLSGAGKSTLIRTVNRMIGVTSGQVLVDGVDVMGLRGRALRRSGGASE